MVSLSKSTSIPSHYEAVDFENAKFWQFDLNRRTAQHYSLSNKGETLFLLLYGDPNVREERGGRGIGGWKKETGTHCVTLSRELRTVVLSFGISAGTHCVTLSRELRTVVLSFGIGAGTHCETLPRELRTVVLTFGIGWRNHGG